MPNDGPSSHRNLGGTMTGMQRDRSLENSIGLGGFGQTRNTAATGTL